MMPHFRRSHQFHRQLEPSDALSGGLNRYVQTEDASQINAEIVRFGLEETLKLTNVVNPEKSRLFARTKPEVTCG